MPLNNISNGAVFRLWKKRIFKRGIMLQMGAIAERILYKRVKSGFGISNGRKQRLKRLSKSYVDYRKGKVFFFTNDNGQVVGATPTDGRQPRLGTFGRPGKSNLTFTGQMLNSIDILTQKEGFKLRIRDNSRRGDKYTNRQIQEFVETERPFFELAQSELRIVEREFVKVARLELNNILRRFKI